jgi:hypothetical protein
VNSNNVKCVEGDEVSSSLNPNDSIVDMNRGVDTNRDVTSAMWNVPLCCQLYSQIEQGFVIQ